MENGGLSSQIEGHEKLPVQNRVQAVIALGMGPVRPQLRGGVGGKKRHIVAHHPRMREIAVAVKELAANGYIDPKGCIIPTGRATANTAETQKALEQRGTETPEELLSLSTEEYKRRFPKFGDFQNYVGQPQSEEEVARVVGISESSLMADLIKKAVSKPGPLDRKEVPPEIIEETEAPNTIQNFVRAINLLDKRTKGVFKGKIGVVSSNFGHLSRARGILLALGIPEEKIVCLSAEQILRHFGYRQSDIDSFKPHNTSAQTLQNQERWIRGVREIPEYVLPEIAFIENDNRLIMVMESLRQLYGKEKLDVLGLGDFDKMRIEDVREILSSVSRKLPPSEWREQADIDVWKAKIDQEDALTSQWLKGKTAV